MPIAIAIVVTLAFGLVNLMPGEPERVIAGGLATEEQVQGIKERLGLDRSVADRYVSYIQDLAHGDLGQSFYSNRSITEEIKQYLPATLELVILSLSLAVTLGLALGGLGAYFRNRAPDHASRFFVTVTQAIPDFFLGLILIYIVFFLLGWAPAPVGRLGLLDEPPERVTGFLTIDSVIAGQWETLLSALHHALLPVLALGLAYSAHFARTTRAVLGDALNSHQAEFARACGLPERTVLAYAFRAARTPIITYIGILFASLIGGAAIVETIFAWNGIGQWAIDGILKLDIPAIQGFILISGLFTLFVFLVLDVLVIFLDPRISYD